MRGITVILYEKKKTGETSLGEPIYDDVPVPVHNVLVGQPSSNDIVTANAMGKHISYMIGIPKGDTHDWMDTEVDFFGKKFRTVGEPMRGISHLTPLSWDQNIMVELYE